MKLKLDCPIILAPGATPIDELTVREHVCAGDMRALNLSDLADPSIGDLLTVAGRLTGQGAVVLDKLSLGDMDRLLEIVLGFFGNGHRTGTTP